MKYTNVLLLSVAAGATGAALLFGAAPAGAAAQSAEVTIDLLEAQGFTVRVDRVGSAPLDQCVVTDIRNPQQQTSFIDDDDDDNPFVDFDDVRRTVTVSVNCAQ